MVRLEVVEEIRSAVEKLRSEDESAVVVVEGPRDEESLRAMGFAGRVITLSSLRSFMRARPSVGKVILLLDFDREGRNMTRRLTKILTSEHVKVDLYYYRMLSAARRVGVNTVQDLVSLLEG